MLVPKKRHVLRWFAVAVLAVAPPAAGCSDDDDSQPPADAGVDAAPDAGPPAIPLEIPCQDSFDDIYGDPGTLPGVPGAILKCAVGEPISREDIEAAVVAQDYSGDPLTSGAQIYRVTYETTRGNGDPGYSSALVLIPDTPRADPLPVIVSSHGSFGQAPLCAPSRFDDASAYVHEDLEGLVFPLVGAGYAVIAPDLAGYANYGAAGNPPSAYASSADTARSSLDGVTALRNLIGEHLADDVVLTGHSQGGHTALSTLALADQFGVDGTLSAVVLYAPLWLTGRIQGAFLYSASSFTLADSAGLVIPAVLYHYTHSELLDGPGHGLDVFRDSAKAAVDEFVNNGCWAPSYPGLEAVATDIGDLFSQEYIDSIAVPAALTGNCGSDAVCQTWMDRFTEDRPHLTGDASQVPMLLAYGGQDDKLTPGLMACVIERLAKHDQANVQGCIDNDSPHDRIPNRVASYASRWIAWKTLGGEDPGTCDDDLSAFITEAGDMVINCEVPPPNL